MMGNTRNEPLLENPKWRPEDLGAPLPDSEHANSVCLPEWRDVIEYEEKSPRVIDKLKAGYPRFVVPAACGQFFEVCRERYGRDGERCHVYPSERSASRCAKYIKQWSGVEARITPWGERRVFVVCFPAEVETWALKYWRHTGDGISSRQAVSLLAGNIEIPTPAVRDQIKERIAGIAGVPADHVFLFKSGMSAIYTLHRMAVARRPEGACVQFGFPYVDTLKILQDFGHRSAFFPLGNKVDLKMLNRMAMIDRIAAVFCEFPSNPLLNSPDLASLAQSARNGQFPLIVDDTISTAVNVNLLAAADVVVTSLTKYFTGRGDIMGGAAVLNPNSPIHDALLAALRSEYEDTVWAENLTLMAVSSEDYPARMQQINRTAEQICDWLVTRPEVKTVYYPKFQTRELYDRYRRPEGGYSGLFSLLLNDAAQTSEPFYNALAFCKGPNLGTHFSLCCPFTMLAHFDELDWAEQCGVSRYLLRFSIGLEPADVLIKRIETALAATHR